MPTIDDYLNKKYKKARTSPVNPGDSFISNVDKIEKISNNKMIDVKSASIIKCSECTNIIGLEDEKSNKVKKCNHCGKQLLQEIGINFNFSDDEILKFHKDYNLKIKKV
jgi:ribosomal protein S27E